jgi:DNA replication initiation complex subunit (GINS family)
MGEDISYDYIWNLYQKEKQTNQLLQLSKAFYPDIMEYLSKATLSDQQKLNMEKILVNLFEKRKQKIFLYLAYNKPLPTQLDSTEQEFYTNILETINKYKIDPTKKIKSNKLLRSLTDIPEIVLPSGRKLGPLKKDEILDMQDSSADVTYLISNAICENYNR